MPERVVLTPLPDDGLLHLAKDVVDGMNLKEDVQVGHDMGKGRMHYEKMSRHDFTTHFCLRFLGRLFSWRKFTSTEGVPCRSVGRAK